MDEPEDHKKRKLGDEGKVADVDSYPEQSGKRQRTHALLGKEVAPSKVGNREVKLLGNYYRVRWAENKIFIHHMHYEPLEEGEATVSVWVKKQVLQANKAELGQYMFWGEHLFSMKDLSGQVFKASVRGIDYTLTLGERILIRDNAAAKERMQMFSNILKSVLARQKFIRIRDSIFDTHKARQIPGYQVEAIPGFSTNIDYFHGGMMLNVDVRWKYTQTKSIKDMFDRKDRNARLALVEGQHVLTMYADRRGDRRFYRVTTIDFDKTPRSTFPKRRRESGAHKYAELKEEEISFLDYYKQTHNITIRDADQPLLKVIEKRRNPTDGTQVEAIIYLIPELCVLAGLPEDMRNDGQLRRKTMEVTTQLPQQRIDEVSSLVSRLQPGHPVPDRRNPGQSMDPGSLLAAWGIQIDSKPLHVLGRGMESETLYLNGRTPKTIGTNGEWRDLFGAPPTQRGGRPAEGGPGLFVPVALNNWALVYLHNNDNAATAMVQAFHTVKKELRMEISDPVRAAVSRTNDLPLEMNKLYEASVRNGRPFDMMVAILPTANAEVYKGVKQIMTNHPVLTQAMKAGNLDGRNIESKCKGVLEQIVSKMGGTPWGVKIPFKTPTMIMGIDVSHSKTTAQGSVLALTATLNDYYSQYFSDVRVQGRNQEMASGIADSFNKALEAFMARNKVFPKRVIVYRDDPGGHGFLAALLESEVEMMQAVLKSRGIEASLAVIVVRKRGLTRLFSEDGRNPLPGTLVDTGLVSKDYNDFYLVAHSSRNGTVAPTQYQIVYRTESPRDEGLATRILQELSYKLCHLYYNFMGTIAEPAPLRYADRLAGFARQTMTRACPVATLADKLYYL